MIDTDKKDSAEKKYTTKEVCSLTGAKQQTLSNWACKGILVPIECKGRRQPSYYSAAQIEEIKALMKTRLKPAKKNAEDKTIPLNFDALEKTQSSDTVLFTETVGDDDDDRKEEFPAVIPTDDDDADDDELIDPPIIDTCAETEKINSAADATVHDTDKQKSDRTANQPKGFLPMAIAPSFETIPQFLKDLKRWICWRLIPREKKNTKVPMTPKFGKLVNADVTKSENWLTFDEAISWYNRGLCSGIGFVLTNQSPKVCCTDIDHCIDADGKLSDVAQAVIATCGNSFVEKSQSGTGIHIWFVDEEFSGGRKKEPVEVYAADRYIAMTGCRVQSSSTELLTVNGACKAVIAKFIGDSGEGNLFDKPARATDSEDKMENVFQFAADAPLSDDDRQLIEFFHSDKCRQSDLNMFNLFAGNKGDYIKTTGSNDDNSEHDIDLCLKLLYYVGGSGTDDEIAQRVLKIFNQSDLAKREKWYQREDYRLRTLNAAFRIWNDNGRNAYIPRQNKVENGLRYEIDSIANCVIKPIDEVSAQIDSLKMELAQANRDLADFNTEKNAAIEKLKNVEKFDAETVFADEVITSAAFAFVDDRKFFSEFKAEIALCNRKNKDAKVDVRSWLADVKQKALEIYDRKKSLTARLDVIKAQISAEGFARQNDDIMQGMRFPTDYEITPYGLVHVDDKEKKYLVCRQPIIIAGKTRNLDEKVYKYSLAYQTKSGKWKMLAPTEAATIFNKNKLVDLANDGLPVTTSNAMYVVDYLDAFRARNETEMPLTYSVNRGGWYTIHGKKIFVDPRRNNFVTDDEGNNIPVKIEDSRSEFAKSLRQVGSIEEWKKAYLLAKKSPVARLMVAAAVAPPLLDVLGERNFLLYVFSPTRAGKTTALMLGASAVGSEKIIRSFDATKNGLIGAAADVNDFPFLIDEKQVADDRIKEQISNLVYALANGIGRTKLNKDSTLKKTQDWRTIATLTGETQLLDDTVTGGANTRLLSIKAPKEILSAADCKAIRDIIRENYGFAFPRVVDKIIEVDKDKMRFMFDSMLDVFAEKFSEILPEYRRYMAVLTLADAILNSVLFGDRIKLDDGSIVKPSDDAIIAAAKFFPLIPTISEIADTPREKEFVRNFIAANQNHFIGGNIEDSKIQGIWGKLDDADGFSYIIPKPLKDACIKEGFDYRKLVADLVVDGFFTPSTTIKKNCKSPLNTFQKKIGKANPYCLRISNALLGTEE